MAVSQRTQKYIWGLFAGRCAICRESLIHKEPTGDGSLVGEIAHIVGEKPKAARGSHPLSVAARDKPENLLLLCRKHHKIIDDAEERYSVDYLQSLRAEYLSWLGDQLAAPEPWRLSVSAFSYLNVPRLSEFAALQGYTVRLPELPEEFSLKELGYGLNSVMTSFRATLENIAFRGVSASRIEFAHEGYIGHIISFDAMGFRTKNVPSIRPKGAIDAAFSGNLNKDPHIYRKFSSWMLVLNINPRWITTSTAYGLFRPSGGVSVFTGFARITDVDISNARMTATTLALGQPQPAFDVFDLKPRQEQQHNLNLEVLEDEATRSRGSLWLGELDACDFCGKDFAEERYMIDGPMKPGGPWGCMCEQCYQKAKLPLGVGKGQLYRRDNGRWMLVGGYPDTEALRDEE